MRRPATLAFAIVCAACVNFRVPYDGPDLGADLPGDVAGEGAGADADAGERPYLDSFTTYDPAWCAYADLPVRASASSVWLDVPAFQSLDDLFQSVEVVCGTPGVGPEEVLRLQAPLGTGLNARLTADWGAVLTLTQGGCRVTHVTTCAASALTDVVVSSPLYLFVEAAAEGEPTGAFSLQVALNHVGGYADCPVQREVHAGAFDVAPVQVDALGASFRQVVLEGDTTLASDRFFLPCADGGATPDGFGGAPDHAVALVADFADGRARRADVALDTGDGWEGVLTVTSAPCGLDTRTLGCAPSALGGAVRDLLLLPGAPVYALIDGRGDDVPAGRAAGPYRLTVTVDEP